VTGLGRVRRAWLPESTWLPEGAFLLALITQLTFVQTKVGGCE
jgi:hypothetical protein